VLVSWAVPKGVSASTKDRRLAVKVEDHPLDYLTFEGEIPEGEYGAGRVEIWDTGEFTFEEQSDGFMCFKLAGKKLQGTWKLIRMRWGKGDSWLLQASGDAKIVDEA